MILSKMILSNITPLILTFNEASNILDTVSRLSWARQIVVVDSFSTDETIEILSQFPNVRVVQREFDQFADQCNFGLDSIETEWVLSLDADYKCPTSLETELIEIDPDKYTAYESKFAYCIFGKPLRATLYPPRKVLYRKSAANYSQDGHAHKVDITGKTGKLKTILLHDDWKPLRTWCAAQVNYANDEVKKLSRIPRSQLSWKDKIRRWYFVAPVLTLFYCLFVRLLILDGWQGIYYSLQRVFAELVLSLSLIDEKLRGSFLNKN